jgi:hypothetical protein
MDQSQRRERIRANLGIKPITHGQIYTFQIAIPDALKQDIAIEQQEAIADSLLQHGSNFFPIIVRPTEDYGEDEEYEVVYGADWCQVAKDRDIEKVWVWVFNLTDEQASATREELESLLPTPSDLPDHDTSKLLDAKLKPILAKLNQITPNSKSKESDLVNLSQRVENLELSLSRVLGLVEEIAIHVIPPPEPPKPNLRTASDSEIKAALQSDGVSTRFQKAAIKAIEKWKAKNELSWENLEKSISSGKYKVNDFGRGTYNSLKAKTDIK